MLSTSLAIDITMILMHYLRNQKPNIKWSSCFSNYKFIDKGVRQGGVLSPFVFTFHINDIITEILSTDVGCTLGGSRCNTLAYADDIITEILSTDVGCTLGGSRCNILAYADGLVLLTATPADMDFLYNKLCLNFKEYGLELNRTKTKCMMVGNRASQNDVQTLTQ